MESKLIITGWIIATLLFVGMHHLYNWCARKIGWDDLQVPITIAYILLNVLYFIFTYHVFKLI